MPGDRAPVPIPLTRAEAAERLRISERTVRRYGKAGLLVEHRLGPKLIRVTAESVEALLAGRAASTEAA